MRASDPARWSGARSGSEPPAARMRSTSRRVTPVRATISAGCVPASAATARMRRPSSGAASSSR